MTELKEQAELLYKHLSETDAKRILGIANGKYKIPDDIDECNDEITEMFEMKKIWGNFIWSFEHMMSSLSRHLWATITCFRSGSAWLWQGRCRQRNIFRKG